MSAAEETVSAEQEAKAEVVTYKEADGSTRTTSFAGKRQMIKDVLFNDDGSLKGVRFDFRNGETITATPREDFIARLAGHGLSQKVGDAAAGEKDVDDMFLAVEAQIQRLDAGEWEIRREGGGMSGTSVLLRALVELSGGKKTVEDVKAWLKPKSPKEKMALRNSAKLKPIVDRLEAEKASKGTTVDTEALLSDFG